MFTIGNVDRHIVLHSIDIAVHSRLSIDRWSTVDRVSVDRAINHWPSIGRYFVDAPQPNIGHMSGVYRSTVGDIFLSVFLAEHVTSTFIVYISRYKSCES